MRASKFVFFFFFVEVGSSCSCYDCKMIIRIIKDRSGAQFEFQDHKHRIHQNGSRSQKGSEENETEHRHQHSDARYHGNATKREPAGSHGYHAADTESASLHSEKSALGRNRCRRVFVCAEGLRIGSYLFALSEKSMKSLC